MLWGIARFDLGLTNTQFWSLCPIEFETLLQRWILKEERLDRRTSLLATILVNVNKGKKGKTVKLEDFMLHDFRGKKTQQGWKQQLDLLKTLQSKVTQGKTGVPSTIVNKV